MTIYIQRYQDLRDRFISIPVISEQELSKVDDRLQKVSNCPSVPYNSRPSSGSWANERYTLYTLWYTQIGDGSDLLLLIAVVFILQNPNPAISRLNRQ